MPQAQETVVEIDLTALQHNFEYLKSRINSKTKIRKIHFIPN